MGTPRAEAVFNKNEAEKGVRYATTIAGLATVSVVAAQNFPPGTNQRDSLIGAVNIMLQANELGMEDLKEQITAIVEDLKEVEETTSQTINKAKEN